jgi:hypothetical protein
LDNDHSELTACGLVNVRLPIRVDETSAATIGAWIQKTATLEHRYALVVFPYSGSLWVQAQSNEDQGLGSYGTVNMPRGSAGLARRLHKVFFTAVSHKGNVTPDQSSAKDVAIPRNYVEAINSPQGPYWIAAMQSEVDSLKGNDTWKLVQSADINDLKVKIVAGRWVFTVKSESTDSLPTRYKARCVVRGFTQRHGIDYDDTYASVTKPATVKIMLAIIAKLDLECKQFDLVTAFLNTLIKKHKIYVEMPHGFEEYDKDGNQLICLLLKALYGLKQSPLLWYEELTEFLH